MCNMAGCEKQMQRNFYKSYLRRWLNASKGFTNWKQCRKATILSWKLFFYIFSKHMASVSDLEIPWYHNALPVKFWPSVTITRINGFDENWKKIFVHRITIYFAMLVFFNRKWFQCFRRAKPMFLKNKSNLFPSKSTSLNEW